MHHNKLLPLHHHAQPLLGYTPHFSPMLRYSFARPCLDNHSLASNWWLASESISECTYSIIKYFDLLAECECLSFSFITILTCCLSSYFSSPFLEDCCRHFRCWRGTRH